jgi:hypothetical protein
MGAIAQLVERLHGMQEVNGSIPFSSTIPLFAVVRSRPKKPSHHQMLGFFYGADAKE